MFLASALLLAFSIAIYRGKTDLIHAYHQTKVTDHSAYGKAFGKALLVVAAAPLLSGVIGLLAGDDNRVVLAVATVLIVLLGVGIGLIVAVQHKYNKGIF